MNYLEDNAYIRMEKRAYEIYNSIKEDPTGMDYWIEKLQIHPSSLNDLFNGHFMFPNGEVAKQLIHTKNYWREVYTAMFKNEKTDKETLRKMFLKEGKGGVNPTFLEEFEEEFYNEL